MIRTRIRVKNYDLSVWEDAAYYRSQDTYLLQSQANYTRIGVFDGLKTLEEDGHFNLLPGTFAANIARTAFMADIHIGQIATDVNTFLTKNNAGQTAFLVAELNENGIKILKGGETTAWVKIKNANTDTYKWKEIFPQTLVLDKYAKRIGGVTTDHIALTPEIINNRDAWHTTILGRFREPKFSAAFVKDWQEIIIASDDARLNKARVNNLSMWINSIREWEDTNLSELGSRRHDDITVMWLKKK